MSTKDRAVVWIGGAAGEGIASTGDIFCKTASRMGLWVFAYNSYQSVIRGGHVYYQVQIGGGEKVLSQGDEPDVLVALNQDTMNRHAAKVVEGGAIIFNQDKIKCENIPLRKNVQLIGIPVEKLTAEFGRNPVMQNTVDSGALIQILGLDWATYEGAIRSIFGSKKSEIADLNIKLASKGAEFAKAGFKPLNIKVQGDGKKRAIATGNSMIAFGALTGGVKFYSAYPMTPASSIMHWLAPRGAKYGLVMKQMEDEIAAMASTVGAGHVGCRSMTGTSGGGFALMTEAIGLAAMTETPCVVAHVMRGGPSTGLPTKTEQADLFQDLGAGQGDYPKAIIAPISVDDCYHATIDALNLSEKYQTPVILVSDLFLSEHAETMDDGLVNPNIKIERGEIVTSWKPSDPAKTITTGHFDKNPDDYLRFKDTPTGVSPRAFPGTENTLFVAASDEHDEEGVVISDVFTDEATRIKMMDKRMRKMAGIEKDTKGPIVTGPKNADVSLVGWGSTYQIIEEVRLALEKKGKSVNHIHFRTVWPIHAEETSKLLNAAKKTINIEVNFTSQMAKIIRMETGYQMHHFINKYDGEPYTFLGLLKQVEACMSGQTTKKVAELAGTR
ncbi:MAG: 2-oxoglutarate oxidoreductase subunit KorA [Elusimicrobia bacterium]|nr:2-oxoglutarate oxidoreductase subunit KorA [Elusimicrobiota bacterium]